MEFEVRLNTTLKPADSERFDPASALLRDIDEATKTLNACLAELDEVLAQSSFNAGALTSVRLRLAGIRLTRGPLITRISDFLASHVSQTERAALEDLRKSHQLILQAATAHTSRWTLDAISRDWTTYRHETQTLVSRWRSKSDQDSRLIYPLIRKAIAA